MPTSPAIAIVGISVELPSGNYSAENLDHSSFFNFLLNSQESYEIIPPGRFNVEAWKGNSLGTIHVDKGSFLKDIDLFDNVEFGISLRDAQCMAPATRKLLENTFLALLDSGIDYRMKNVGCFTSATSIELTNVSEPDEFEARGSFGGYPSMIANRISNHLDLLGPSLPVDTACSSTLTATHLAVQSLLNGECEAAVVAGCQLNHRLIDWILYSQGSLLAKGGKCKPFDSSADGFSRAEGCVAIVIKPLDHAIRDHDHIYATILGTSINSTGSAAPPGAPVADSQRDVMLEAFRRAGKKPQDVDFIELHATGTAKGDPTEANWVGANFRRSDELLIGSVKGNIGHTEISAFLASLSKVISIIRHKVIPPTVNVKNLNPAIKWSEYQLRVPIASEPLPCRSGGKSVISIAGSGIGGSNGHVVLESAPVPKVFFGGRSQLALLISSGLSGRTATSIGDSIRQSLADDRSDIHGLATLLGRQAKQMTWRSYAIVNDDLASPPVFSNAQHCPRGQNPLVFVFSGQGPQYPDMGKELFSTFPVFRQSVLEMDEVFRRLTNKSVIHDCGLFSGHQASALPDVWPIALVLPSIAIFQMALFDLLVSFGVKPDIVIGHSAGETSVLYASGAASKTMAVELAIIRGNTFTQLESLGGAMAALGCGPAEAEDLLREVRNELPETIVELACHNSPFAVAVAGQESGIDHLVKVADTRGVFARKIRTRVPFHSSAMEECREQYIGALKALFERYPGPHKPNVLMYSTFTGSLFTDSLSAEYYWLNTRFPVQFTQAMSDLTSTLSSAASFVEISPHPVLSSYIQSMIDENSVILPTIQRPKRGGASTESLNVLDLLGKLTVNGHNCVDFTLLNNRACYETQVLLPKYPFSKKRFALYPDTPGFAKQMDQRNGPINHGYLKMNKDTHPMLAEHVIRGEPIMPAAGFLEMAIEFGATTLINVNLRSILSLSSENPVKIEVALDQSFWTVKSVVSTKTHNANTSKVTKRLHADGYLSFEPAAVYPRVDVEAIRRRCSSQVTSGFYPALAYFSTYGPKFQRVTNIFYGSDEALVSLKGMDRDLAEDGNYFLHPAILDACLHLTAYKPFHGDYDPNAYFLPAHLDALVIHQVLKHKYFPFHLYAHVELRKWLPDRMCYNITVVDDLGSPLCTFRNLEVEKHHVNPIADAVQGFEVICQPATPPKRSHSVDSSLDLDVGDPSSRLLHEKAKRTPSPLFQCLSPSSGDTASLVTCNGTWGCDAEDRQPSCDFMSNVISHTADALSSAFMHLVRTSFRVARVLLVFGDMDLIVHRIIKGVEDCSELYIDLHMDGNSYPSFSSPHCTVRPAAFRLHDGELPEDLRNCFDIIVLCNVTSLAVGQIHSFIRKCNDLLIPGGSLIITACSPMEHSSASAIQQTMKGGHSESSPSYLFMDALSKADFLLLQIPDQSTAFIVSFTLRSQKNVLPPQSTVSLLELEQPGLHYYIYGQETALQESFGRLDNKKPECLWILAQEGRDGGAAFGFVRALRKEYLNWTVRLIVVPQYCDMQSQPKHLESLPLHLKDELDIIISSSNTDLAFPFIPRIALIPPSKSKKSKHHLIQREQRLPLDHVTVKVEAYSIQIGCTSFVATVIDGQNTGYKDGSIILGLTTAAPAKFLTVDVAATYSLPEFLTPQSTFIAASLPGFINAVLGPGLSTFVRRCRLSSLNILLTHCDSVTGLSIEALYSSQNVRVTKVDRKASLLDLAVLEGAPFDLILSGYDDKSYVQILKTLLHPNRGKLFLWEHDVDGLGGLLKREPCTIGDTLQYLANLLETTCNFHLPSDMLGIPGQNLKHVVEIDIDLRQAIFDPGKIYLLLGGIGTLGAHLAQFMYQRGARHIIVTSRSGERSLQKHGNSVILRIFNYLRDLPDLNLRFEAMDATSASSMSALMDTVNPANVGGCVILTGFLIDRVFKDLTQAEFSSVCASKVDVFDAASRHLDFESLDFVIAFTSVSGLFGTGGQTNYSAANTALEELVSKLSNGFSFICPGIIDSAMMLAGAEEGKEAKLSQVLQWSMSAQEMIRHLEEAVYQFQSGSRFSRYLPALNWEVLDRVQTMPQLGRHLVPTDVSSMEVEKDDGEKLATIIKTILSIPDHDFSPDVPFTAYGIDSLSASRISFQLRSIVEVTQIQLLANITFNDLLRMQIQSNEALPSQPTINSPSSQGDSDELTEMVARYTESLGPVSAAVFEPNAERGEIVLVTGTTGSLGCNILHQLLLNNDISRIYAVNRKNKNVPLLERQTANFLDHGIPVHLLDSEKLVLVEGDLLDGDFGVPEQMMGEMLQRVTHIIHNAWTVNFLIGLKDYDDLIKGTRRLLDFASQSRRPTPPSFSCISTIALFHNRSEDVTIHPEETIYNPGVVKGTGYLESKWVAERIVQTVGEKCGLRTNVIRAGVLTGGSGSGAWDPSHWVPAMIQSGKYLGCLPDGDSLISWLPVDLAAAAIVDLRTSTTGPGETFHVVHPRPVRWNTIMNAVSTLLKVPLVPYVEWLARLEAAASSPRCDLPEDSRLTVDAALRLTYLWRLGLKNRGPLGETESMALLPKVASKKAVEASETLKRMMDEMQEVGEKDVERWLGYWRGLGLVPDM